MLILTLTLTRVWCSYYKTVLEARLFGPYRPDAFEGETPLVTHALLNPHPHPHPYPHHSPSPLTTHHSTFTLTAHHSPFTLTQTLTLALSKP